MMSESFAARFEMAKRERGRSPRAAAHKRVQERGPPNARARVAVRNEYFALALVMQSGEI